MKSVRFSSDTDLDKASSATLGGRGSSSRGKVGGANSVVPLLLLCSKWLAPPSSRPLGAQALSLSSCHQSLLCSTKQSLLVTHPLSGENHTHEHTHTHTHTHTYTYTLWAFSLPQFPSAAALPSNQHHPRCKRQALCERLARPSTVYSPTLQTRMPCAVSGSAETSSLASPSNCRPLAAQYSEWTHPPPCTATPSL